MDRILLRQIGDFRLRSLGDWRPATAATTSRFGRGGIIAAAFGTHRLNVGVRTLLDIPFARGKRFIFLCRCRLRLGGGRPLISGLRISPGCTVGWRLTGLRLCWRGDLGRL